MLACTALGRSVGFEQILVPLRYTRCSVRSKPYLFFFLVSGSDLVCHEFKNLYESTLDQAPRLPWCYEASRKLLYCTVSRPANARFPENYCGHLSSSRSYVLSSCCPLISGEEGSAGTRRKTRTGSTPLLPLQALRMRLWYCLKYHAHTARTPLSIVNVITV
jgi:hypothetical protein